MCASDSRTSAGGGSLLSRLRRRSFGLRVPAVGSFLLLSASKLGGPANPPDDLTKGLASMRKKHWASMTGAVLVAVTALSGSATAAPAGAPSMASACGDAFYSSRSEGHAWIRYCDNKTWAWADVTDDKADGRCPRLTAQLMSGGHVHSLGVGPKDSTQYREVRASARNPIYVAGLSWVSC